ncbi:MAG: HAMP domain-containing histidine kinase [Lachnospiraceae bacterium]|nr:HAMP domain-containing histidine kinase [Lachnospiraceae bacterium]
MSMSKVQRVLLALACILYAATIFGFFRFGIYLEILLFLMHSLCLILFTYRTYADVRNDEIAEDTRQQDIGIQLAEKDKEILDMHTLLQEKESAYMTLTREHDVLRFEAEKMKEDMEALEGKLKEIREEAEKEAMKAKDLSSLLPPSDLSYEEHSVVNIIDLANQARSELMESAKAANLHVSVSSSSEMLLVRADPNRLKVLFRNIIDNSIKYMNRPGSLVITISSLGDDIFIVLKDTGEGLPEKETKHIFELNYQGSNRLSGNGLGLAQARAIVEYYGGTIYAKSTEGGGMGIYIQLPA